MYKELLLKLCKNNAWVDLQPPCSIEEILSAENEMHIIFPDELTSMLRECNGDGGWALLSAREIIFLNEDLRNYWREFFISDKGRADLYHDNVESFLFFAQNGCGDYFAYRIDQNRRVIDPSVYIWEHELLSEERCYRKVAENLIDFIEKYYTDKI